VTAAPAEPMANVTTGGFTVAYLRDLPDDGLRRELINGSILVSPSATFRHNLIATMIANQIRAAPHDKGLVVGTDQSVVIDTHNELRPDIVVASAIVFDETPFPSDELLLAAEVVSPSSALYDTEVKKTVYARAGVPAYWIVVPDPDAETIALAELRLSDETGRYEYVTPYTTTVFRTDRPWPVEIDLAALAGELAEARRTAQRNRRRDT
jgi:Uma2 family endonuclease